MPVQDSWLFLPLAALITLLFVAGALAADNRSAGPASPVIAGVAIFPPDHTWNVPIDTLPVYPRSAEYIARIGSGGRLHPDFGSGLWEGRPIGIPFNLVDDSVRKQVVTFEYDDESDPGPYPIPDNPLIEGGDAGGGDRHLLIVQKDEHILYELYAAEQQPDGSWHAGSGAIFDLAGYGLRPAGWTSADAAGLAILPGLVRYDEVAAGEIRHAIRVTAPKTQRAYIWPARHYASGITDSSYPPMGQRFRLKASFDTSGYPPQAKVVLEALKKYGMILSDNGAPWYITGAPDERWDNDDLHTLGSVRGSDFEAVDTSSLIIDPDSGQARIVPEQRSVTPDSPVSPPARHDTGDGTTGQNAVEVTNAPHMFLPLLPADTIRGIIAFFDRDGNGRIGYEDFLRFFIPA